MPINDALGDRMKAYENKSRIYLDRKTPVIIRVDGKAFHTFTRGFEKPFDDILEKAMKNTMTYLCENIQGAVLGYTQSDEITIVLIDYQEENSDAWFGYNLQKMASVAASMATMAFNKFFDSEVRKWAYENQSSTNVNNLRSVYYNATLKGAMFDARAFSLPKFEVVNCLIWRQLDAIRNSIQAIGQSQFSHKELQNLNCDEIKEKLISERGLNWEEYSDYHKHGICCVKVEKEFVNDEGQKYTRKKWELEDIDFLKEKTFIKELIKENNND